MSGREEISREACEVVDGGVREPVIVLGSLPPYGTDIDLLVREDEELAIRAALRAAGFAEQGAKLARFGYGTGLEVELLPAAGLRLPAAELDALFEQAAPLPGFNRLCKPAPHHRLLILATRLLAPGTRLSERRVERIRGALAEDPAAWQGAVARAAAWGDDGRALGRLRAACEGAPPDLADRLRHRLGQLRRRAVRGRSGALIALSGIDGSGKSSQARALAGALDSIGIATDIEWIPLASNAWLKRLADPVKRVLGRHRAFRPKRPAGGAEQGLAPNPGSMLRDRSRTVNHVWAVLVAIGNGISHRSRVARQRAAGRVVIFDRYVLDSVARLRFLYGEDRPLRLPRALIRLLSPRPSAAFFLDIPAPGSIARKADIWHIEELERQARLYREEHARYGVVRLDGERPPEEIAAEIATEVWRRVR